jgi:hypothetical protein
LQAHEILEVRPGATRREVTEAFRRFALRNHPDRGGDAARFQTGVDAYRRLAGAAGTARVASDTNIVFHRRSRPGVPALLRLAGRRLATFRPRP